MVCELYLNIERRRERGQIWICTLALQSFLISSPWRVPHRLCIRKLWPRLLLILLASTRRSNQATGTCPRPHISSDRAGNQSPCPHTSEPPKSLFSFPRKWRPWNAVGSKTYTSFFFFFFLMCTWPPSSTPIREQTPIIPNRVTAAHPDDEAERLGNSFSPSPHRVQGTAWASLTFPPLPFSFSSLSVSLASPF